MPSTAAADLTTLDVNIVVEEIAILLVLDAEGGMVIDDGSVTIMGNPSSQGSVLDTIDGDYAVVALLTNVCLDTVLVEFVRASDFRNTAPGSFLGVATGQDSGNLLGVWPRAFRVDNLNGNLIQPGFAHEGVDDDLVVRGPDGADHQFCNGVHRIALGVTAGWDTTSPGEPEFAVPDTYVIPLVGTLVP